MRLSLYRHEHGVETADGPRVVFDLTRGEAHFGAARVDGPALCWELEPDGPDPSDALLSRRVTLDPAASWIVRCDRIDFPPAGVAYTHTHPGPGLRYLLHGRLEIRTEGHATVYGPGGAWFESGPDPVHATAGDEGETAFVRVLVLPAEWEGKRTIRYVDPADADRPKLQRPTVFFDRAVALP